MAPSLPSVMQAPKMPEPEPRVFCGATPIWVKPHNFRKIIIDHLHHIQFALWVIAVVEAAIYLVLGIIIGVFIYVDQKLFDQEIFQTWFLIASILPLLLVAVLVVVLLMRHECLMFWWGACKVRSKQNM